MERTADLRKPDKNGKTWPLTMYACRPPQPATAHYEYRMLPHGEVVLPIVNSDGKFEEGRYRWTDAKTGEVHETVRKKRAVRKDRVMPDTKCPRHGCPLIPRRGPWWRGRKKLWLAVCPEGNERYHVPRDGSASPPTSGGKRKPGRHPGRSAITVARITIAANLRLTNPKASIYSMVGTLFPEQNLKDRAYNNAKQLFVRNNEQIESERKRLAALPPTSRALIVEQAKQRLLSR
jgi:hypothetical protein